MTKTLKMIFALENGNRLTYNLVDPKEALTRAEVEAVMNNMILKQAVDVEGFHGIAIYDTYIYATDRIELE